MRAVSVTSCGAPGSAALAGPPAPHLREYESFTLEADDRGADASYRRSVRRLWTRLRGANPLVVDSVFAALVMVAGLISLTAEPTPDHPTPTDALAIVLVVVGFGAIALRRRRPVGVLVVATLATIVYVVRDYPDNGLPVMALIALYTVATLRRRAVWVAAVTVYLALLLISVVTHPEELSLGDFVGNVAIFGIAAVFGDSVRVRRAYTRRPRPGPPTSSATSRPRPSGRWPRSGCASPASCTTWWPTP